MCVCVCVCIKQPSSRLTLAVLRQGQKHTARAAACKPRGQIQLAVGQLARGGTWVATRGLIFHERKSLPVRTHMHVKGRSACREFTVTDEQPYI